MNRCAVNGRVVQASRREFGFTFLVTFIQECAGARLHGSAGGCDATAFCGLADVIDGLIKYLGGHAS